MPNVNKDSLELVRLGLGILSFGDLEDKEQSEIERKEYCAAISAVWPRLEKDIKKALYDQLIKTSMQSETWEQVLVGRGVFAGMEILLEHWRKAASEHNERLKGEDKFDKSSPIGEI